MQESTLSVILVAGRQLALEHLLEPRQHADAAKGRGEVDGDGRGLGAVLWGVSRVIRVAERVTVNFGSGYGYRMILDDVSASDGLDQACEVSSRHAIVDRQARECVRERVCEWEIVTH